MLSETAIVALGFASQMSFDQAGASLGQLANLDTDAH